MLWNCYSERHREPFVKMVGPKLVRGTLARRFPNLELDRQRKVSATSFFQSLLASELPALANAAGNFPVLSGLGVLDGKRWVWQSERELRKVARNGNGPGVSLI